MWLEKAWSLYKKGMKNPIKMWISMLVFFKLYPKKLFMPTKQLWWTTEISEAFCDICAYFSRIKSYSWDVRNYARYIMPFHNDQPKALKANKTVRFSNTVVKEKLSKGFNVNFTSLELACVFNVSLKETSLISVWNIRWYQAQVSLGIS